VESNRPKSKTFGVYNVLNELGRGGMGIVYKAHEESLGRDVALKILPARLAAHENVVERFQREARAGASLSHPSITPIYAVGEHKGTHFIAMEYVRGPTLAQLIKEKGPVEIGEALRIVKEVADALREAHRHGILHRDIKPANIMFDHRRRVKVMDFGLARVASETSQITGDGARLGTPAYMSPEQCEGKQLDVRSDIYSLGVTLYQMLTKQTPFPGDDPRSVMFNITGGTFPNIAEKRPDLPEGVCQLLRNMIARDPVHRYDSVRSLIADVEHLIADVKYPVELPGGGGLGIAESTRPSPIAQKKSDAHDTRSTRQRGSSVPLLVGGTVVFVIVGIALAVFNYSWSPEPAIRLADPIIPVEEIAVEQPTTHIDGLVAYWSFDEGQGVVADDEIGGNSGVLHSATWTHGVRGTALEFAGGQSSYVEVPHSEELSPTKAVTVTAWAKVYDFSQRFAGVVYKSSEERRESHSDRAYALWVYHKRTDVYAAHWVSTPEGAIRPITHTTEQNQYELNQFFHIAGVVDTENNEMSMYVNGARVSVTIYEGDAIRGGKAPLRIGGIYRRAVNPQQSAGGILGVLDEIRIYNRALSTEEIGADMASVEFTENTNILSTYADSVIEYSPGSGVGDQHSYANQALGVPDWGRDNNEKFVSLGVNGSLTLKFEHRALVASGDSGADLWVHEVGLDEPVRVEISEFGSRWVDVGSTRKSFSGIDIDAYIGRGVEPMASYRYVRLVDLSNRTKAPNAGADIDAVALLSSRPVDVSR